MTEVATLTGTLPFAPVAARPGSFIALVNELAELRQEPGVPLAAFEGSARLFDVRHERFAIKVPWPVTLPADNSYSLLKPTDQFVRYMAAFRAQDWELVSVIQQGGLS